MSTESIRSTASSILIVDDDPDICEALKDLLEFEGYPVQLVDSGAEAIADVKEHRYLAVVLDLGLPDLDGISVLEALVALDPNLPVIILTANTTGEKKSAAFRLGAFAYLTKPYDHDELKGTLRRAVGGRSQRSGPNLSNTP